MKTSVRFLSLILALIMIAGMALTASADNTDKIANEEALDFLVNLGIFGGYDDGSLKPNDLVQRDEMAKIIFVLYTTFSEAGAGAESFADVPADNWAAGYVSWCSANNIVGGYGNGKFGPDDNVTYDQALKMVCGALGYKDWDSRFWPTDVRRTALTTLGLGENISGVKGSDFVTRAQIAQIVYNALSADMNETKKVEYGFEVPMTLKEDVWKVTETNDTVLATEHLSRESNVATGKDDKIILENYKDATLKELCLEKYTGKTDELIAAQVTIIKRNDEILGTTIKSVYEENIKVTLNKDKKLCINGEELSDDEVAGLKKCTVDSKGKVTLTAFDKDADVPSDKFDYVATYCDVNANGKYDNGDWIKCEDYSVYKVDNIGKSSTTFALLDKIGEGSNLKVDNEDIISASALAEDDVVVVVDKKYAVEVVKVVAPITATVTKFGNNKLTLDNGTQYTVNTDVFKNAKKLALTNDVIKKDANNEAQKFDFYIFNGKIFYAPTVSTTATANNYAILAYVETPTVPVLDPVTQKFTSAYDAVLVINGKETKVPLNAKEAFIDVDGTTVISIADEYQKYQKHIKDAEKNPADKIFAPFGKEANIDKDGYLRANYTLVTYKVDEDGLYTIKLVEKDAKDYIILQKGAKITVQDIESGIFKVEGTKLDGKPFSSSKVVLSDATAIYYPYEKDDTGYHLYLGVYNPDDFNKEIGILETTGFTYIYKPEDSKLFTLETAVITGAIKEGGIGNYKTDARAIMYCYSDSTQEYVVDEGAIFSSHYFMDIKTLKNLGGVVDTKKRDKDAEELTAVNFYAYDEEAKKYVKINAKTEGVECIKTGVISEVFNGFIYTTEGDYATGVKIPDSAVIWTTSVSVNGDTSTTSYKQLTLEEVEACLQFIEDKKGLKDNNGNPLLGKGNDEEMDALFFTYEDSEGKECISSVFVDFWSESTNGDIHPHSTAIINSFGTK